MNRKQTLLALFVLAIGTASLVGQNPPSPPDPATMAQHRVQFLTTLLSLNSQQQQQALTIFTNAATSQSTVHDSMRTAHEALRSAVKNNDSAGITQAATTIGSLTAEMTVTQAKADVAFNALLNADQQSKLSQLESQGHGRHGGPGPMFDVHP